MIDDTCKGPATLAEKIWDRHRIVSVEGEHLLHVDRLFLHEGSSHAFAALAKLGRDVHRPDQVVACADHYVPTSGRENGIDAIPDPAIRGMVRGLEANARSHGIIYVGADDPRQGILHVVAPEQGVTQPGLLIAGADSHTTTHGAFGCLAFGIGASEALHVLATQTLWLRRPKMMRVLLQGTLGPYVSAKDVVLALIARIGAGGAIGHIVEYAGTAVERMTMEQQLTLCNMAVEAGGRAGIIAPDETTYQYLAERPWAPRGADWDSALAYWRSLPSDPGAVFDREVTLDVGEVAPTVTWGTSPEHAAGIDGTIPDPASIADPERRREIEAALDYMGLEPGVPLTSVAVDRVFIGSCTNSRRRATGISAAGRA